MFGVYGINPMMQYNMGAMAAMNQIQAASFMSMPTFGSGDCVPFNMDYPLFGGGFMPFNYGMGFMGCGCGLMFGGLF